MAYDALGMLIDGTIVLSPTTDVAAISLTRNATYGCAAIDLRKTGEKGLCAVMTCPLKPTTYADTLTMVIEQSDILGEPTGLGTWETVASFPIVYALLREMEVTATTAFVAADIGAVIAATTDSASDAGVMLWFDPALLAIDGVGKMVVQMSDANDDYSTAGDTLTSADTGVGTQTLASTVSPLTSAGIPGVYAVRFQATKRYLRAKPTVSTGGSFGLVSVLLTDYAEFPLYKNVPV